MRVHLVTCGSAGDLFPFLAIGRAAVARGHDVRVFTHPIFRQEVAHAGLPFAPVAEQVDLDGALERLAVSRSGAAALLILRTIRAAIPGSVATLRRAFDDLRPDIVLAHPNCVGARWASEAVGVPFALATLNPAKWLHSHDRIPPLQRRPGRTGAAVARLEQRLLLPLLERALALELRRLRRRLGLPAERDTLRRDLYGGCLNLGLWSPHFRAAAPGDPPGSEICGFTWYDGAQASTPSDRCALRCLERGRKTIVFALGTVAVRAPGDFFSVAADACRRMHADGVLLTGRGRPAPSGLPPGIRALEYAPLSTLLPFATAIVHHGGIGTLSQSLRHGVPMVLAPRVNDQFNNAVRAHALEVAAIVPRRRLTGERIAAQLATLDGRPTPSQLARRVAAEDGADAAVRSLERAV